MKQPIDHFAPLFVNTLTTLIVIAVLDRIPFVHRLIRNIWAYYLLWRQRARINQSSFASHPGQIALSPERLRSLRPDWYPTTRNPLRWLEQVSGPSLQMRFLVTDQLNHGDTRAAVVVSLQPLLIAAYTDELDCVAMLRFPDEYVDRDNLVLNQHLVTVNWYQRGEMIASDLVSGPLSLGQYTNFQPLIAEFLTEDTTILQRKHAHIAEDEWRRATILGYQYLAKPGALARDGRPYYCYQPAQLPTT